MSKPVKVIPIVSASAEVEDSAQFVSMYQKQPTIYPRAVKGWFASWRWVFVWLTQLLFYGLPWLQWNGRQAVLFDLEAQRFFIFGLVLYPQDLIFLAALLVLSALALFFFTAVAGRLWCGYTCPQTVYTEIFMWAERHRSKATARRACGWTRAVAVEQAAAQGRQALGVAGDRLVHRLQLRRLLHADPRARSGYGELELVPWNAFWVLFYGPPPTATRASCASRCASTCAPTRASRAPDRQGLANHHLRRGRGEPRGSRSRKLGLRAHGLGDCIDCTLCVQVCPTGIDIRNGLQNECIGCAACIDVCNDVMDKMGYAQRAHPLLHRERRGERLDTAADVQARAAPACADLRRSAFGGQRRLRSQRGAAQPVPSSMWSRTVARWPAWWRKARLRTSTACRS
jgi:formate hydrogenlyase subunit 6/NADH:ubiquinone oxidoreductase subunit I